MRYLLYLLLTSTSLLAAASGLNGEVLVNVGTSGTNALPSSRTTNTTVLVQSTAGDGSTAMTINAATTHTSGRLLEVQDNATNIFTLESSGNIVVYPAFEGSPTMAVHAGPVGSSAEYTYGQLGPYFLTMTYLNNDLVYFSPLEGDGSVPYRLNAGITHTTGNLVEIQNNGTNVFQVTFDGAVALSGQTNQLSISGGSLLLDGNPIGGTTSYISNLYVTNLTVNNLNVTTNINVQDITVTNNITIKGNATVNSLVVTNNLTIGTIQGTIDPSVSGLTLKQKRQLPLLRFPDKVDGAGCTYANTNDFTAVTFMRPTFSAAGATNANFCQFSCLVPADLDTSVDLTATLKVQLGGGDTAASTYTVGMVSIANSAAGAGTPANYVTLTVGADGSGASGDVEGVNDVTLTGWRSAMTPGQFLLIQLQRDGTDASAVAESLLLLELTYGSTQ